VAAKKPPKPPPRRRHEGPSVRVVNPEPKRKKPHPLPEVTPDVDRYDEAIHAFERRLPVSRGEWDKLAERERKFAFTVSAVSQADMILDVYDAIEAAVRDGTDLETFKANVQESLFKEWGAEDASRVETIFRTNVQTAYNEGRYEVYSAPAVKEARPYFRFDAIDDDRADDECLDLNGTVLEQDDEFWDENHPPLHFNCRCVITGLSKEEAEDEGVDEAPDTDHADDGFGGRPEREGENWEPDLGKYPEEIRDELEARIKV
jgi:SPP1 gp7 family putative phage head morphogenesis protein